MSQKDRWEVSHLRIVKGYQIWRCSVRILGVPLAHYTNVRSTVKRAAQR